MDALFTTIKALAVPEPGGERQGAHLMAAGGPQGCPPALVLFRTGHEEQPEDGIGKVLAGGCIDDWAAARGLHGALAPPTLATAVDLAVASCRAFITEVYASCGYTRLEEFPGFRGEPGGLFPGMAFPLHVVVITPSEVKKFEVPQ